MELRILSAKEYNVKLKCTIHSTGKLGFTEETAKQMKLSEFSFIKFALDESDILYLIHSNTKDDDCFNVSKAGRYFYINAKGLFDSLNLDYINHTIIFDMVEVKDEGEKIYKLKERRKPRKQSMEE